MKRIILLLTILLAFIGYNNAQSKKPVAAKKRDELKKIEGDWYNFDLEYFRIHGASKKVLSKIRPYSFSIDSLGFLTIYPSVEQSLKIGYIDSIMTDSDRKIVYHFRRDLHFVLFPENDTMLYFVNSLVDWSGGIVFIKRKY